MRTRTLVHTPEERRAARQAGEQRTRLSMVQLLCVTSILRTLLTKIIPLAGSAGWWTALLCFLPGLLTVLLLRLVMRLTGVSTLQECVRACLGRRLGSVLPAVLLSGLLLLDGAASLTALVTMFTQGIGTRGTQLTMALLTCGVLLCCLHREGLPRAVHLLRPVMLASAAIILVCAGPNLHPDGFFPLHGDGAASIRTALQQGMSLAWPLVLLLTMPSETSNRAAASVPPLSFCAGTLLFLVLVCPHEQLIHQQTLAGSLLIPAVYTSSAVRTLAQCLAMLTLFLGTGSAVQLASEQLCAPAGDGPSWLPYVLLALLAGTQLLNPASLWQGLSILTPWLLAPLTMLGVLCLILLPFRRNVA